MMSSVYSHNQKHKKAQRFSDESDEYETQNKFWTDEYETQNKFWNNA